MGKKRKAAEEETQWVDASEVDVDKYIPTPPDGGYGWVIVIASLVCNIIVDGIGYTFGIFLLEFVHVFKEPKSKISLVGSVQMGTYLCVGPIVSGLTNKFGCRPVCVVGSFIAFAAFCLACIAPSVEILILTYGVMAGFGFGMMYLPAIVSVGFYFERRRAVATGIAVCGSGIGTFIFAPFSDFLLKEFGWKGALLILAGIVANGMVFGALMRPLKPTRPASIEMEELKVGMNGAGKEEDGRRQDGAGDKALLTPDRGQGTAIFASAPNIVVSGVGGDTPEKKGRKQRTVTESEATDASALMGGIQVIDMERTHSHAHPDGRAHDQPGLWIGSVRIVDMETGHGSSLRIGSLAGIHKIALSSTDVDRVKQDLQRPLYRKDIFYSGSVQNIPQYGPSLQDLTSYIKSVTSIASIVEEDIRDTCFSKMTCLPKSIRDTLSSMLDCSLLRDWNFLMILLGNVIAMLGYYVPFVYVADRAVILGIDESRAALLISIIGIMNIIGRILAGAIADFKFVNSLLLNNVAMLICGVSTILCPFCDDYVSLCVFVTVFGLCVATYISLTSIILCDLLGLENLTNAFGLLTLARGVSSIAGPPLAGAVYDSTQNFDISFFMGGSLILGGTFCHFLLHLPCFRNRVMTRISEEPIGDVAGK